ncbi:MAG: hypothetical protein M3O50_06095, partial [Myxococcota bacterium]|nr:hypothetical protein [Myxococcota bacterium]
PALRTSPDAQWRLAATAVSPLPGAEAPCASKAERCLWTRLLAVHVERLEGAFRVCGEPAICAEAYVVR